MARAGGVSTTDSWEKRRFPTSLRQNYWLRYERSKTEAHWKLHTEQRETSDRFCDDQLAHAVNWHRGNYEIDFLRHMAAAANRFWRNYDPSDPSTAPTACQAVQSNSHPHSRKANTGEASRLF
ncbi:MAG: hypothetical protein ACI8WM_000851 [Burkholderiaceae bacterium]|jgi:hypothetical protein